MQAPTKRCAATNFEGTGSTGGKEGDVCMATRKEGGNPLPSLLPLEPVPSKLVAAQRLVGACTADRDLPDTWFQLARGQRSSPVSSCLFCQIVSYFTISVELIMNCDFMSGDQDFKTRLQGTGTGCVGRWIRRSKPSILPHRI